MKARLTLDIADWKKGFAAAKKDMLTFADQTKRQSDALKNIGVVGGAGFLALAAAIGVAVNQARTLDEALANLKAVTGATAQEIAKASEAAKKFGPAVGVSAADATLAIEEFSKAGVDMSRLINGEVKDALDLMIGGQLEAGDAAGMAANAFAVYKDESLSLKQVADSVIGAANASSTSAKEMSDAYRQLGGTAKDLGVDFADVNTQLAIFAQNGLRGSDGATSLKTTMIQLAAPTKEADETMKQIGFSAFDASGNLKSFVDIADNLRRSLAEYDKQSQEAIMATIAGTDGIRSMSAWLKMTRDDWDAMTAAISKVSAGDVAATRMESINAQLRELGANANVAASNFSETLLPAVSSVIGGLNGLIQSYNELKPATQTTITNTTLAGTAMLGTAGALALATLAFGKLRLAIMGVDTAMTILKRHPLILGLSLVAGAVTFLTLRHKEAAEAAKVQADAQERLNSAIRNAATEKDPAKIEQYKEEAKALGDLVKQYDDIAPRVAELENMKFDWSQQEEAAKAKAELDELKPRLDAVIQGFADHGTTVEGVRDKLATLNGELAKNVDHVIDSTETQRNAIVAKRDAANELSSLSQEYAKSSASTSVNTEEIERNNAIVEKLAAQVPGLTTAVDEHGRMTITNTSLINDKVLALNSEADAQAKMLEAVYEGVIGALEIEKQGYEARLSNLISFEEQRAAAMGTAPAIDDSDLWGDQNARERYNRELATTNVGLGKMRSLLGSLKDGSGIKAPSTSGTKKWTPPDTSSGRKGEDPAKAAERAIREAYQARLSMIEHEAAQGILVGGNYVAALKTLQSDYTGWLADNLDERLTLEKSVSDAVAAHWTGTIEDTKKAMERQGKTAMEIAEYEVRAAQEAMNVAGLSAKARLEFEDRYYAAKHALQDADLDHSRRWIEETDKEMERAGKSELDRLRMRSQALERMNSRAGSGRYTLEQEKEIADDLADSYYRLGQAMNEAEQSAIDMQEKMATQRLEESHERTVKAIEDEIAALEEKTALEDFSLRIAREQEELAKLRADREKVAADKRFEFITRDKDGNLVAKRVADLARLEELDEQIADRQRNIAEMRRQEDIRLEREALQKKLEQERQNFEQRKAAQAQFFAWLREATTKANEDVTKAEGTKLAERFAQVQSYVAKTKAAFAELNAAISKGMVSVPAGVTLPSGVNAPSKPDLSQIGKIGGAVGGTVGGLLGTFLQRLPKFHGGGAIPGRKGEEVPIMAQAGEFMLSLDHLRQTSSLDTQMRTLMASNRTVPSMSMLGASTAPLGQVSIDIGGINLQERSPREIADQIGGIVSRRIFDEIDREFWRKIR